MVKICKVVSKTVSQTPLSEKLEETLASLRLENITLSPETVRDLQLVESGKLSKKEAITKILARVSK